MPWAFYILSNWANQSALDEHAAGGHVRRLLDQAAPDLVASHTQTHARMLSSPDANPDRARPLAGSSTQVTLVPSFSIKPGQVEAVRQAHLRMVDRTRAEPGCLDYDLYQSLREVAWIRGIERRSLFERPVHCGAFSKPLAVTFV